MPKKEEIPEVVTYDSPLASWPGAISLPAPDIFDGVMWQSWRESVEQHDKLSVNRLYAYAGAEFITAGNGTWKIDTPSLSEFTKWRTKPMDERLRLVSWVGKRFQQYMNSIVDPKD